MYLPPNVLYTFLISLGSGVLGAMLGLGGGTIMVPLLIFLLGVPIHIASGASIVAVVATSSAAAISYVRDEMTNMRLGMFLELATTIGAVTGAVLVSVASESTLRVIFGLSLLYASGTMYLQSRRMERSWAQRQNDALADRLELGGSYFDSARNETITYGVGNTPKTLMVSYFAGIVSGLLGIGGGGIKVPAMNSIAGVPMKVAVATSNFMIGVTAAASALVHLRNGYCDAFVTAPVVLGALLGAFIGARFIKHVRGVDIKRMFIFILLVLGLRMILSGAGVA
jgi:uncharacterized membrane protein YfcA